jgi:hypothetical protein
VIACQAAWICISCCRDARYTTAQGDYARAGGRKRVRRREGCREALGCRKMGWEIGMDRRLEEHAQSTMGTGLEDLRDRRPCALLACDVCWQTRPDPCRKSLGGLQRRMQCAVLFTVAVLYVPEQSIPRRRDTAGTRDFSKQRLHRQAIHR